MECLGFVTGRPTTSTIFVPESNLNYGIEGREGRREQGLRTQSPYVRRPLLPSSHTTIFRCEKANVLEGTGQERP